MKALTFLTVILVQLQLWAGTEGLYIRSFGDAKNPALVFLHGGPGYNCSTFEVSTAERLAEKGFYVIVYDRRGEGRSSKTDAAFTFDESCADLLSVLDEHSVQKARLIGHSFGGIVAIEFARRHPDRVERLYMAGAPLNLQESFQTILDNATEYYEARADTFALKSLQMLKAMDRASLLFANFCFIHAMQTGAYACKQPTEESQALIAEMKKSPYALHFNKMEVDAPQGFYASENYTNHDYTGDLEMLIGKGIPVRGIYGREDGLYSEAQVEKMKLVMGWENLHYLENCSHSSFIDQQQSFISILSR